MIARLASLGHVFVSRMRLGRQYRIRFCTTLLYGGLQNSRLLVRVTVSDNNRIASVNQTRCEKGVTEEKGGET